MLKFLVFLISLTLLNSCFLDDANIVRDERARVSNTSTKTGLHFASSKKAKMGANEVTENVIVPGEKLVVANLPEVISPPAFKGEPHLIVQEVVVTKAPDIIKDPAPAAPVASEHQSWLWPNKGTVVKRYSEQSHTKKGIEIKGKLGDPILASASGKVVYKGNGIRGYGELLIIKHQNGFLSAYGHNQSILVEEGDQVNRGQVIARMGELSTGNYGLHFEIRKNGTPVDPMKYLP